MAARAVRFARNATVLLIALIAALLVFHRFAPTQIGERLLASALRPVQSVLVRVTPSRTPPNAAGGAVDKEALLRLQIENAKLREALHLQDEETNLRRTLETRNLAGVNVQVIGRSADGDTNVLIVGAGSEQGIKSGEPVVAENGVLVGTILTANPGRSTVLLLTHPRSAVGVELQNATRTPGIVAGQHGTSLRMRLIPQGETVEKGMAVVTAPVQETIPAGLLIGEITDTHFQTGDLFQEATLQPLVDYQRLRMVSVILSKP